MDAEESWREFFRSSASAFLANRRTKRIPEKPWRSGWLLLLVALMIPGCVLNSHSVDKVAADLKRVPITGNRNSLSDANLSAAVRTLGNWPVYRLRVVDRDGLVADMQPSLSGDTTIERVNGQWRRGEHVVVTP